MSPWRAHGETMTCASMLCLFPRFFLSVKLSGSLYQRLARGAGYTSFPIFINLFLMPNQTQGDDMVVDMKAQKRTIEGIVKDNAKWDICIQSPLQNPKHKCNTANNIPSQQYTKSQTRKSQNHKPQNHKITNQRRHQSVIFLFENVRFHVLFFWYVFA